MTRKLWFIYATAIGCAALYLAADAAVSQIVPHGMQTPPDLYSVLGAPVIETVIMLAILSCAEIVAGPRWAALPTGAAMGVMHMIPVFAATVYIALSFAGMTYQFVAFRRAPAHAFAGVVLTHMLVNLAVMFAA